MIDHKIVPGLSTIYKREGSHSDTLSTSGSSGIMEFLVSTPAILSMAIKASSEMLDPLLPDGYISVGKNIDLTHERPTLIGETITLIITVSKVKGENIYLEITGHDSTGVICKGVYERSIVDKNHLIDVAYKRSKHGL
jgi:fluoroacetyl-CoA thioesterase